jgi:flagellar FliL protein
MEAPMPLDEGAKDENAEEIEVGKRSKLPFILGALAFFAGGGGIGWGVSAFLSPDDPTAAATAEGEKGSAASASGDQPDVDTKMTSLGKFTVNLRDSAGGRVLQMEIQVESEMGTAETIEKRMPQLRDSVILLSSDYSYSELEGIDGKLRLRDEIHARINAVMDPAQVSRVYFTAFVVQ